MTQTEMVTACALSRAGQPIRIYDLIDELNAYLKSIGLEPEEYEFNVSPGRDGTTSMPEKYRWLVAFAVKGNSEGYYIHVGTIQGPTYIELGLAKTYTPGNAYAIAREAQRFLTAAQWN